MAYYRVIIIVSKKENFIGSAKKIKHELNIPCEILYLEDIIDNTEYIKDTDIIYVLANGKDVYTFIAMIKNKKSYIFNKQFYLENLTKLQIQQKLKLNNVLVPEILSKNNKCIKMPVFVKENKQAGIVFQAYTNDTIKLFFSKFDINNFYLEESLNNINDNHREYKVYYANNKVNYKDNVVINDEKIELIVKNVAKILNLDVMSLDLIKFEKKYYIIDVNPAAGFYFSSEARKELIKKIGEFL